MIERAEGLVYCKITAGDADIITIAGNVATRKAEFKLSLLVDGGEGVDTYTPGSFLIGTPTVVNVP